MMEKVTLQPGDYVATADIKDEAEYHAIARAFMEAGADSGEYPAPGQVYPIFGWREKGDKLFHGFNNSSWGKRQLTPAQILATPQWVPEVGFKGECNNGGSSDYFDCEVVAFHYKTGRPILETKGCTGKMLTEKPECWKIRSKPTEEDRAVEEMMEDAYISDSTVNAGIMRSLYRAGYRKQPQPAEDIDFNDPANWRAGDLVECVDKGNSSCFTKGKLYTIGKITDEDVMVLEDDDGEENGFHARRFRFHSRP